MKRTDVQRGDWVRAKPSTVGRSAVLHTFYDAVSGQELPTVARVRALADDSCVVEWFPETREGPPIRLNPVPLALLEQCPD